MKSIIVVREKERERGAARMTGEGAVRGGGHPRRHSIMTISPQGPPADIPHFDKCSGKSKSILSQKAPGVLTGWRRAGLRGWETSWREWRNGPGWLGAASTGRQGRK